MNQQIAKLVATVPARYLFPRIANLINELVTGGLVEQCLSLLVWEKKCRIKDEYGTLHGHPIPIFALERLLLGVICRCDLGVSNQLSVKTIEALNTYFSVFSSSFDTHFSEIDKIIVVFRTYANLVQRIPSQALGQIKVLEVEEASIQFSLKYLSCPIFERKYSAISALNTRIEEIKKLTDKDKDRYRAILLRYPLLDTLYISGYQPEIARKSDEIFAFVAPSLSIQTINNLLVSAFEQSSEKGGVIAYCLRKSLQTLDIELIKGVLETLASGAVPAEKLESETIQLIIEVIRLGGEKTSRFSFLKNSKEGTKLVEDAVGLLWSCLDSKNNLQATTVKSVMDALEDNVGKARGGRQRMVEQCILKLREKRCPTQYIVLLKALLESMDAKGNFILGSEYDKLMEKAYTFGGLPLPTLALNEFIECTRRTQAEEEPAFNEDKVSTSRIQLILLLIFKGRQKSDTLTSFKKLLSFLLATADQAKNLNRLTNYLTNNDVIPSENGDTFFSVLNDQDAIDDQYITENIFRLYETLFLRANMKSGALDYANPQKKTLLRIARQEKLTHLQQLWVFCLKRRLTGIVRDNFHKLLVECYFRTARKYESTEAQKAWTSLNNDVNDQISLIRQTTNATAKAILLSNMAHIWIKVIYISLGTLYIGGSTPSPETLVTNVVGIMIKASVFLQE